MLLKKKFETRCNDKKKMKKINKKVVTVLIKIFILIKS